ncbi:MAG: 23S rRNA (adenine(2503)-C(2))-methyltransferase RlmN [Bacilli bacterium]|nr:23S rRNA (adenine(2503)-C(2))-methyltransferase RlmN [Bacilli bacterium]
MNNIYNYTLDELEEYFLSIGEKKFKALQIFDWLYKKRVKCIDEMTNIKKDTLKNIENNFKFDKIEIVDIKNGKDVKKYLFKLEDGNYIEAVLMIHNYGNSLCISTQVGCNMGCKFCESGRLKKKRNLETYEMVQQILVIEDVEKLRISHVVLMGIGEPFDNYDNVLKFIRIINNPKGLELGARHITISTCGLVDKIRKFMNENLQVNLAISFHAPNDEIRNKIMPINKRYNISELIGVIKEYIKKTNRRVTFEYIMLEGINDSKECAKELSILLKGLNAYVNMIPYNETNNIEYKRTKNEKIVEFYDILKKNGINVTVRREFGSLIDAACGQLRSKHEEE